MEGPVWTFTTSTTSSPLAYNESPTDGDPNVLLNVPLSWTASSCAATHDLFVGTSYSEVDTATSAIHPSVSYYDVGSATSYGYGIDYDTTYYWRVDSVDGLDNWKGNIWSFTTTTYTGEAGPVNPEDFERYSPISDWQPTQGGEGWAISTSEPPDRPVNILSSAGPDGSLALELYHYIDSSNARIYWYANTDNTASSVTFKMDFKLVQGNETGYDDCRLMVSLYQDLYHSVSSFVFRNKPGGNETIILCREADVTTHIEDIPGGPASRGVWYTVEMECDIANNRTRARFGPTGGSMGSWSVYAPAVTIPDYPYVDIGFNGKVYIDNLILTSLP